MLIPHVEGARQVKVFLQVATRLAYLLITLLNAPTRPAWFRNRPATLGKKVSTIQVALVTLLVFPGIAAVWGPDSSYNALQHGTWAIVVSFRFWKVWLVGFWAFDVKETRSYP